MSTFLFVCNLPAETVPIRARVLCQKAVHGYRTRETCSFDLSCDIVYQDSK